MSKRLKKNPRTEIYHPKPKKEFFKEFKSMNQIDIETKHEYAEKYFPKDNSKIKLVNLAGETIDSSFTFDYALPQDWLENFSKRHNLRYIEVSNTTFMIYVKGSSYPFSMLEYINDAIVKDGSFQAHRYLANPRTEIYHPKPTKKSQLFKEFNTIIPKMAFDKIDYANKHLPYTGELLEGIQLPDTPDKFYFDYDLNPPERWIKSFCESEKIQPSIIYDTIFWIKLTSVDGNVIYSYPFSMLYDMNVKLISDGYSQIHRYMKSFDKNPRTEIYHPKPKPDIKTGDYVVVTDEKSPEILGYRGLVTEHGNFDYITVYLYYPHQMSNVTLELYDVKRLNKYRKGMVVYLTEDVVAYTIKKLRGSKGVVESLTTEGQYLIKYSDRSVLRLSEEQITDRPPESPNPRTEIYHPKPDVDIKADDFVVIRHKELYGYSGHIISKYEDEGKTYVIVWVTKDASGNTFDEYPNRFVYNIDSVRRLNKFRIGQSIEFEGKKGYIKNIFKHGEYQIKFNDDTEILCLIDDKKLVKSNPRTEIYHPKPELHIKEGDVVQIKSGYYGGYSGFVRYIGKKGDKIDVRVNLTRDAGHILCVVNNGSLMSFDIENVVRLNKFREGQRVEVDGKKGCIQDIDAFRYHIYFDIGSFGWYSFGDKITAQNPRTEIYHPKPVTPENFVEIAKNNNWSEEKVVQEFVKLSEGQRNWYVEVYGHYAEPGYSTEKKWIITADWNNIPRGLGFFIAKIVEAEWFDEWWSCSDCGGLIKTVESTTYKIENGEIYCHKCKNMHNPRTEIYHPKPHQNIKESDYVKIINKNKEGYNTISEVSFIFGDEKLSLTKQRDAYDKSDVVRLNKFQIGDCVLLDYDSPHYNDKYGEVDINYKNKSGIIDRISMIISQDKNNTPLFFYKVDFMNEEQHQCGTLFNIEERHLKHEYPQKTTSNPRTEIYHPKPKLILEFSVGDYAVTKKSTKAGDTPQPGENDVYLVEDIIIRNGKLRRVLIRLLHDDIGLGPFLYAPSKLKRLNRFRKNDIVKYKETNEIGKIIHLLPYEKISKLNLQIPAHVQYMVQFGEKLGKDIETCYEGELELVSQNPRTEIYHPKTTKKFCESKDKCNYFLDNVCYYYSDKTTEQEQQEIHIRRVSNKECLVKCRAGYFCGDVLNHIGHHVAYAAFGSIAHWTDK